MRNNMLKKCLVCGITLLFIEVNCIANIVGNSDGAYKGFTNLLSPPAEQWNTTFGGTAYDYGRSAQQTSDGGYIFTGETRSFGAGSGDVWLVKINATGQEQWNQTYGTSNWEGGYSVQQTNDGGYVISGFTYSYGVGDEDVWLIKTDGNGNELWNRTFGGSSADWGNHVEQTSDGGYIITGSISGYSGMWLIKTDDNGIELWNSTFSTGGNEGYYVQQTTDNGYILVGKGNWLIKTYTNGTLEWARTFPGIDIERGHCVRQTSDSGYIFCGFTSSNGNDVLLLKTDSLGYEQWNKTYGGINEDRGYSVQQVADEGYIVVGYTYSFGAGSYDTWLIRTDDVGNELWNKTFGGVNGDEGCSIKQTTDGGFIICGDTESYGSGNRDAWLIKIVNETTPSNVYVDDDYNQYTPGWMYDHFSSIQDGINAVVENGTVYVYNGTYTELITVNHEYVRIEKSLNLIGENKETTILNCPDPGYDFIGIDIRENIHDVNISGFTVQGYHQISIGIYANWNCDKVRIEECIVHACSEGISCRFGCSNVTIRNCVSYDNNRDGGISFSETDYNNIVISDCVVHNNSNGINANNIIDCILKNITSYSNNPGVGICLGTSQNGTISNSICYKNNDDGIRINSCQNSRVVNCSVYNNSDDGIDLSWAPCINNVISGNNCTNNRHGIILYQADNNHIYENNLFLNREYGIYPWDSSNNIIYHNNLINNNENAIDTNNNTWYNITFHEGNYWSDYSGVDDNGDGIGDTPYNVSGGSNQDLYPLMHPFEMYFILDILPPNMPIYEGDDFPILVYSLANIPVQNAKVEFDNISYTTDSNGSVWLTAPLVEEDSFYEITANKDGYIGANETIVVRNIPQELTKAFIFGKIANLSSPGDYSTFEAVKTRVIMFSPFSFYTYVSGEEFTLSKEYRGFIGLRFIFALCEILI